MLVYRLKIIFFILILSHISAVQSQKLVDVLIVGGGAGGTSAGIQAARMGVKVHILEATPWLGGMLTAAGVSAIDGNHEMPSGIWGEFRQHLYDHYGGPKALATGWVSHSLFEPSVGNKILQKMASIPNLDISFNAAYTKIERNGTGWLVTFRKNNVPHTIQCKILIDATETGDLLPQVGAAFRLGMDSKNETGEKEAPELANDIVQDLTYVLILKDVGNLPGKQGLVKKPKGYSPNDYACACSREGGEMFGAVSDCLQMLNYGKLPNNKYMINWPICGNDFYLNWPQLSQKERIERLKEAKAFTQGFIYYIQNELGYRHLRVANEFPSKDNFPMIPYERESRRLKAKVFLTVDHLERPYDFDLYKTGIAVGDYPIDHHHDKNPDAPEINFINIKIPSYNIPLGCLIPQHIENFIVAEKNIGVSNIVNGTTRLQPVVLGIGQAAGALAATSVITNKMPSEISVRGVQRALLARNAYLMPYFDVKKEDLGFTAIQRIGATGILKGYGVPYKWANQTWFYPEQTVSEYEWKQGLMPYFENLKGLPASGKGVTLDFIAAVFQKINPEYTEETVKENWKSWEIAQIHHADVHYNRRTISMLTDKVLKPFDIEVDLNGQFIND